MMKFLIIFQNNLHPQEIFKFGEFNKRLFSFVLFSFPRVGITSAKMKDIKSLMVYLSEEGRAFYNQYFAKINIKKTVVKKYSKVIHHSSDEANSDED